MVKLNDVTCSICHKQIDDSTDMKYEEGFGMVHETCADHVDTSETLANTILANTLMSIGEIREYYGGTRLPQHFDNGACHWVNIRHIDTDDTWSFFNGTFATSSDTCSVITGIVDCACGKIEHQEIGIMMSIPDVINRGIELGLVNDIGHK